MIDIQNQQDTREIPLKKVGIKGLKYPVQVLDRQQKKQATTATVDLYVNLPKHFKGTHMSRFIEVFHKHYHNLSMKDFLAMLDEIRTTLEAAESFGKMTFTYFMEKEAPVSKQKAIMSYECTYEGCVKGKDLSDSEFTVSVSVPVTTLCPCSKAISDFGAHNQRGIVTVKMQKSSFFWLEDIIELIEKSASSAIYSLLKREDEKFVTEQAYSNPRFVEDIVREVYIALTDFDKNHPFKWFSVEAENFESIHNHSAFAYTEFSGTDLQ